MIKRALVTVVAAAGLALTASAPAFAAQPYPINFKNFPLGSYASVSGTTVSGGAVTLASAGLASFPYTDPFADYSGDGADGSGAYRSGSWTSPDTPLSFGFNELVASWNADTPDGTWIQVEMRPKMLDGHWAKPYILGRWSSSDSDFHRTSVGGQGDADGYVAIDTFFAKDHLAVAYQLKVTLFRRAGSSASPTLTRLSAVAMNVRNQKNTFPSDTTITQERDLHLPQYSQEIHHGDFPQYDNGGEAWCSPTSTSMVVRYWGAAFQPTPAEYEWVTDVLGASHADPWVDFTARAVYDYRYNGAGNWPFNAAYAASRGLVADVAALHNLHEAEPYIQAGVPLVASVAWSSNKLEGGIKSTNGHLMVIGGFTASGDVIAYDPASDTDALVRHVYDREQFERAWIPASGGIVYVIRTGGPSIVDSLLTTNNS
ncbi:MAG TPA: C39 family peptidase [Gaiellaceae bacterium]|nr:C39 family peptidase [Gaiellaceae bacterium]